MNAICGLYAIADTDHVPAHRLLTVAAAVIDGGARVLQYRAKDGDRARQIHEAAALAALCRRTGTVFIVNDDVHLAADVDADGVHIGIDDGSVDEARARLGGGRLVGVSCYNRLARACDASRRGADYVAFGSFYPSPTKPAAVRATPELLHRARDSLDIPIVAIGGITPENGAALLDAGADALAVISAVFGAPDPQAAAASFATLFRNPDNRRTS